MNLKEQSFLFISMCNKYMYNIKYTLYFDNSFWVGGQDNVQETICKGFSKDTD